MWILTRLLIIVPVLLLIQFYFSKKVKFIFQTLFPDLPHIIRKISIRIILFFLNLYPVFLVVIILYSVITKQSVSIPQNWLFDYFIVYPFWTVLLIIVQIIILFIIIDFIKLIFYPLYKKNRDVLVRYYAIILFGILIVFIIYVPFRIIYDYYSVNIRSIEFVKADIPEELEDFKITLISDIQADRFTDEHRLQNYIDAVNSTDPDLVLIAGDVITSTPNYIETASKFIGRIKSKYGVYSCVGDHDNWAYRQDTRRSIKEITEALNKYQIEMIDNDVRVIEINNARIGITFITNTYTETISDELLSNISDKNHMDFKIFLTHQPLRFLIESAGKFNYDLFLAGHTHGGQITFLFPFIRISPTLFETRYVKGDFYFDDMLAIISGGLGMSIAPIRYNSTPEIVVVKLKGK
jgi:predicted MPP superfamily phosphohydrolase